MHQFFTSGGQSTGVSASASVLSMNIRDWFLLGWTGWISLLSKRLSRVFSNTTVQKHQFFGAQLSCKDGLDKGQKWYGPNRSRRYYKKRWQEYTEELYKKDLHDPDNHNSVITHLEPGILECEVKWTLESIPLNKASGGDGIPVELFQILKDNAAKVLHSICQQIWKTQQGPWYWKRSVIIPIPKKGNARECSNYCTIALISHASKVILKIL